MGTGRAWKQEVPTVVHTGDISCQDHSANYRPRIRTKILGYRPIELFLLGIPQIGSEGDGYSAHVGKGYWECPLLGSMSNGFET